MTIELKVPEAGESINEVYIGQWYKAEGDFLDEDEEVVELESEKANLDLPAPAAGRLEKILKQTGETATPGETIGYLDESAEREGEEPRGEAAPSEEPPAEEAPQAEPDTKQKGRRRERKPEQEAESPEDGAEPAPEEGAPAVMPAARRLLAEHDLRPDDVRATGPGGRLLKEDVLRHVERERERSTAEPEVTSAPEPEDKQFERQEEIMPMSPIRRTIARRLVQAQQTAALLTTFNEIDMSAVIALREKHRDAFQQKYEIKLGFLSFFVKATIEALKQYPEVNAEVRGDDIAYRNYYDIGIAVATDRGLVVPVLRNAERLSFAEIESAIDDFATRARDNNLEVQELRGGTFTISNGGIYGSLLSTPIVNPPQSGVLGMHRIEDRPVARDGNVVVRPMMYVALTYDHRVVDGREAVLFLSHVKELVEEPARILIEV